MKIFYRCVVMFCCAISFCEGSVRFLHIPKTGGTTLSKILKQNFPSSDFYPYVSLIKLLPRRAHEFAPVETIEELPFMDEEVVWGHFPYWFFVEKDPHVETAYFFTSLRDPVERVLSSDRHRMRSAVKNGCAPISAPLDVASNGMCTMLSSRPGLKGEELLEDCMQTLDRMDFILFLDDFEYGVKKLCKELGLKCPREVPHQNVTQKHPVSEELIEEIKRRNDLDIRLYEYAKEKYGRKI